MKKIKNSIKSDKKYTQGKGKYTHPPLLFSQGFYIFNKINKILKQKHKYKKNKIIKILDLGCAQGAGSFFALREFNPKLVVGVDNDQEAIKNAKQSQKRKNIKKINFIKNDIFDFTKKNKQKFELIVANGVLPYLLSQKKLSRVFSYINNSLSDNGVFCFSMFSSNEPFKLKTSIEDISSFSPNNKYNQFALIVNIKDLINMINENNLSIYNDKFTYQKRFDIDLKSKNKKNLKADSNFSYFFVIKKDLYSLL